MKRTVLVTGGNTGIGKATAIALAREGFSVVFTSRDLVRGERAADEIRRASGSDDVTVMPLDLGSFRSIRAFAEAFLASRPRLDVFVANAGLVLTERHLTEDGFEQTFGVNHVGHFLLTKLLLPRIEASAPARILVLSSRAHRQAIGGLDWDDLGRERSYVGFQVYAQSKLANLYFARELARRLDPAKVVVHAIHPGVVATEFAGSADARGPVAWFFRFFRPFLRTAEEGARTTVFLATSDEAAKSTGGYWANGKPAKPTRVGRDDAAARRLWELTEALVAKASSAA